MTVETMPTLNSTLLFDLIRWAERDDAIDHKWWGTWDQGTWGWAVTEETERAARNGACKTAYCMAGQAAHQAGYRLEYHPYDSVYKDIWMHDGSHVEGKVATASTCVPQYDTGAKDSKGRPIWADVPDAESQMISVVGREALGLADFEAELFFDGDNRLPKLRALANLFCQDRGLPLLFPFDDVWDEDEDDEED